MENNNFPLTKNNYVELFLEGENYHTKYLELIQKASLTIHLQTYIFSIDSFGKKVYLELIAAAKRGVKVYVLVDGVGSRLLAKEAEKEFTDAGVYFYRFNSIKIKWLYRWGRRLHHKVLIIDQSQAIVGGINVISSPTTNGNNQLDFAVFIEGPAISRLTRYAQSIFKTASQKKWHFPIIAAPHAKKNGLDVKILVNDWVYRRWQITRQYANLTKKAKHEITIINSYFFPRKKFMRQLVEARRRGVRVCLILPKHSDWPTYVLASEYLYSYFLKNDVEIYLWKKSILHGKMATIDNLWCTIGSFNLNYTSYQQNLEMNINIYSSEFTNLVNVKIEELISCGCEKIDVNNFLIKCSLKTRMTRLFYYLILSTIANFSIGLTHQEDSNSESRYMNILRFFVALVFLMIGIFGILFPLFPGLPFLFLSFILLYKQILLNNKKEKF